MLVRIMPAKKTTLTKQERAKRFRTMVREVGASSDPKVLDKALKKIAAGKRSVRPQ
jgi:hypothetical protein